MRSLEMVVKIRVLARQGKSIKEIARDTGLSRNTVRKCRGTEMAPVYGPRAPQPAKLEPYRRELKPKPVAEPLVRLETEPGKQLQVDFVVIRRGRDRLSAFVATLGCSRQTFVYFVTDECIATLLACLRRTFDAFDGVPKHVLSDNLKTVVVERDASGDGQHRFHPQLLQLAKVCGFLIRLRLIRATIISGRCWQHTPGVFWSQETTCC